MGHNVAVCYGTFTGLGVADADLPGGKDGPVYKEGLKAIFLWQILYLSNFVFIKCSICLTLLRIALVPWHRRLLWAMIAASALSTTVVDIFILAHCKPVSGSWRMPTDPATGEALYECLPSAAEVSITFIISAFTLATDFAAALLPYLIIRDLHMPPRRKRGLMVIMGVGLLASVATLARLPFARSYFEDDNYLVGLGHIILWTVLECDLALILGCMPMLHRLVRGFSPSASRQPYHAAAGNAAAATPSSMELVTIGQRSDRQRQRHHVSITAAKYHGHDGGHGNSDDGGDDDSFGRGRGGHNDGGRGGGGGSSESARGITVQQELVVTVREDRLSDRNIDSGATTHQAKAYV
ncbi:hypothetical protein N3K66_004947 [Trichothecium roseum]|uniref:Uncharacterized protein n=1 Tax=Trichothecium roseum TaxID=47278 RepID=A0ACC0V2N8_9HYPO|nr:hypothetical protein N3K66_004947 [Trichothecium roseum]